MNSNPTSEHKSFLRRLVARRAFRIFLFTCAVLVTLLALWHAEENWRGARAWNNYKRQRAAAGESFDSASVVPPRVPDDQNFAMTPFFAPLFDFKPGTQTHRDPKAYDRTMRFLDDIPAGWKSSSDTDLVSLANEILHPKNKPANTTPDVTHQKDAARLILQNFEKYSPVVEELRRASERPYVRFNIAYDSPDKLAILLPHLAVLRNMCRMLMIRATAELALDQTDQACADVELAVFLAESPKSEQIVISQLVRQAALKFALEPVVIGLKNHQWSDAQLQKLQARLEDINLVAGLKISLDGESKFFVGSALDDLKAHYNRLKLINRWQSMMSPHPTEESDNPLFDFLFFLAVPRGWVDFEQLNYQKTFVDRMQTAIDLPNRAFDPEVAGAADLFLMRTKARGPWSNAFYHEVVATLALPSFHRLAQKTAWIQAQVNMTQVGCALERYRLANGQYPENVSAVTPRFINTLPNDPIKGGALKYHRTDSGFSLYSVGWNGVDDDGKGMDPNGKAQLVDAKHGDWIWGAPVSFGPIREQ